MDKSERLLKLRDVIKGIWKARRRGDLTPLQLVLLAYPLAGVSKAKTLSDGVHVATNAFKQSKEYVVDFFRRYYINLTDGETFSEPEIESAENGAVFLIHEHFKDVFDARLGDVYKVEVKHACFGDIYEVDIPPHNRHAERLINATDARAFLNVSTKDFEEYTVDFECKRYQLANGAVAYDWADIQRMKEIILNEENAPLYLFGDAEIDKKVFLVADLFNMIGG